MKKQICLLASLLVLSLAGCSNEATSKGTSSSDSSAISKEASSSLASESSVDASSTSVSYSSSSSSVSSSEDPDDQIFARDDGEALEVKDVASPYKVGTTTNAAKYDYSSVYANKPTNELSSEFAYGVDASSLYEVEKAGGRFYDEEGKEQDLFLILKNGGTNYVRFRLWVDPYDKYGASYGGGTNDISTDIYLAKRAKAAGLKVMVDFHYSDSWVDPSKKWSPKAWMSLVNGKPTINEKTQYKRVGDYTAHALNAFKNAGITVDSVQIGNEINNGIAGSSNAISKWAGQMVKAGVETAKQIFPDVKTVVHLTNITNPKGVYQVYDRLVKWGVDWDVCGLSYYPYWHGDRENLQTVMDYCASTYGKEVMIVETAWGYTDEGASFCNNQFKSSMNETGGYLTSAQAQVSELSELCDCLSKVPESKGTGIFYWEPAWLAKEGAGWISKSGYFYNDHGYDYESPSDLTSYTDSSCYSSWGNQAWFDYSGKALPSYKAYSLIQSGCNSKKEESLGLTKSEFTATYNLSDHTDSIPETGYIITNLDRLLTSSITWDADQLASLENADEGTYTIKGKIEDYDVTCKVTAYFNYVKDNSFENQNTSSGNANEYKVGSPWTLDASTSKVRVETKSEGNRTGTHYFHWWNSAAFNFVLSQKMASVPAGTYELSTYVISNMADEKGGYTKANLFYQIGDGEKVSVSMLSNLKGYAAGLVEWSVPSIEVPSVSDVTIGMEVEAGAESWGHNDDWSFAKEC